MNDSETDQGRFETEIKQAILILMGPNIFDGRHIPDKVNGYKYTKALQPKNVSKVGKDAPHGGSPDRSVKSAPNCYPK